MGRVPVAAQRHCGKGDATGATTKALRSLTDTVGARLQNGVCWRAPDYQQPVASGGLPAAAQVRRLQVHPGKAGRVPRTCGDHSAQPGHAVKIGDDEVNQTSLPPGRSVWKKPTSAKGETCQARPGAAAEGPAGTRAEPDAEAGWAADCREALLIFSPCSNHFWIYPLWMR